MKPAKPVERSWSYSDVLLSDALVFVLVDWKLISSLKGLTVFKLQEALCGFELDTGHTTDIVDLA